MLSFDFETCHFNPPGNIVLADHLKWVLPVKVFAMNGKASF